MSLRFLFLICEFSLFFGSLFLAQAEDSVLLPESWRLQQNLGQIHNEIVQIQYSMDYLTENNQKLHQILGALNKNVGSLQLSQANKELSQALHTFLQETELLIAQYQQLTLRYQKLGPYLQQFRQELEKEQQNNQQKIRQLRQEIVTLQQKGQDLLFSYRQSQYVQTGSQLRQLFQLDQKHLQTKSLLLEQQKEKQNHLTQMAQQLTEIEWVATQIGLSFPQFLQLLQEEKQYIVEVAHFQIGLLQNSVYVGQIQQGQKQIHSLEKTLFAQLDIYTQTREQLEEKMFQLRHSMLEETSNLFPKPPSLFSKKE